jgi:MOSC domain-containing protein YiiM
MMTVIAAFPRSEEELRAGLELVRAAPRDQGVLRLIVRRPAVDLREALAVGELDVEVGLVGDRWAERLSRPSAEAIPDRSAQVTLMSARYAALIAGERDRWAQAGDQLYVDLDLSIDNLPAGSLLSVGTAVLRMSEEPHTGCAKFMARFGSPAWRLANSDEGRALRLRGANASVVASGSVRQGDVISKT